MFKRPQTYFAAALPLAIPLVLAALSGVEPSAAPAPVHSAAMVGINYADLTPPSPATLPEHSTLLTIEEDDTQKQPFQTLNMEPSGQ